jgi:protein-disulfide isomerase
MTPKRLPLAPGLGWLVASAIAILGAALVVFSDSAVYWRSQAADAQSTMPKDEFERRVRAYILENPEVIAEAMQRLELRERAAQANAAKSVLQARADEIFRDPESPVGGNPEGDITLVEFFDYNCPYCRQVVPHVVKAEANDPKLRIVYKEFPILGPDSTFAAKAALAAHRQGKAKYVALHKALMETKGKVAEKAVFDAVGRVGLDVKRLKADMADPAIQAHIDRNLALARALQINGTPSFVIGEQIVPGAVDLPTLERLIREAREKK